MNPRAGDERGPRAARSAARWCPRSPCAKTSIWAARRRRARAPPRPRRGPPGLVLGRRRRLRRVQRLPVEDHRVGEGPADVDPEEHPAKLQGRGGGKRCRRGKWRTLPLRAGVSSLITVPPGDRFLRRRSGGRRRSFSCEARPGDPGAPAPDRRRSPRGACAKGSSRAPATGRADMACPCGCGRGIRERTRRARRRPAVAPDRPVRIDVAVDHLPDTQLVADRDMPAPWLNSQRAGRAKWRRSVTSRRMAPRRRRGRAACSAPSRIMLGLYNCRSDLSVDRTAELVHIFLTPFVSGPWSLPGHPCTSPLEAGVSMPTGCEKARAID